MISRLLRIFALTMLLFGLLSIGTGYYALHHADATGAAFTQDRHHHHDRNRNRNRDGNSDTGGNAHGVPEPSTMALLAAGIAGAGVYTRVRNRKKQD